MPTFQGKRVSGRWKRVLTAADRNIDFQLNSGRRTMAEQTALFRQNMIRPGVPKPGRPLTAFPNPLAPHIRVGLPNHAVDVDMFAADGVQALAAWLRKKGATPTFPVRGEGWHLELALADLVKLDRRLKREQRERKRRRERREQRTMKMSARGRDFLIREEGVRRYAYNDPAGHATFGVGHLLHHGAVTANDRAVWGTEANPKPMTMVHEVLARDLEQYEAAVRQAVTVPLEQTEFDALVSLAFNIGVGAFRGSSVVRELNAGHRYRAGKAFLMWRRAGGDPDLLLPRRRRERRLFRKGKYT
jgi:lysozyme